MSERILSRMMRAAGDGLHDRLMVERNSTKAWYCEFVCALVRVRPKFR
jgi:hypothetical protein